MCESTLYRDSVADERDLKQAFTTSNDTGKVPTANDSNNLQYFAKFQFFTFRYTALEKVQLESLLNKMRTIQYTLLSLCLTVSLICGRIEDKIALTPTWLIPS